MILDVEPESDPIRLPVVSDKGGYDPHCLGLHSSTRDPFAYLGSLHESALSVRHLGRAARWYVHCTLMAAAGVAADVTSLTCQKLKVSKEAEA